jgi:hypothetical protein
MAQPKQKNVLSKRAEERFIQAGRRVLLDGGYPNPERVGCPGSEVLKAIAFRKIPLKDVIDYVDHMGYCSPCFAEYTAFREQLKRRKALELTLGSLTLLAMIGGGVWLWRAHRLPGLGGKPNVPTVAMYRPFFLDLRNWIVFRGEQPPGAHRGPIQLPRERLDMMIWLPVGSEAGNYDVQVMTELGKSLVTATGPAVIRKDGVTALKVKLDITKLNPGSYVLSVGRPGAAANSYPLLVK